MGRAWLKGRRGKQRTGEHLPYDKPACGFVSRTGSLYCFLIRVQRRGRDWQVLLFRHSGVEKAAFAKASLAGIMKILFEKRSGKW